MSVRPATPQAVFDRVASRYDLLNRLASLGLDATWRRRAAQCIPSPLGGRILDIATGTGALAEALQTAHSQARVVGCDLNSAMLAVAKQRQRVRLLARGRGEELPFRSSLFDVVTIAFAIDDMQDREACAREMFRVLKPGGQLVLLELALPENPALLRAYRSVWAVLPKLVGAWTPSAYEHLKTEILSYRGREAAEALLRAAGAHAYHRENLSGGLVVLHVATKARV